MNVMRAELDAMKRELGEARWHLGLALSRLSMHSMDSRSAARAVKIAGEAADCLATVDMVLTNICPDDIEE